MQPSRFMQRALKLAQRAAGDTSPNPLVGAVVVGAGKIVGEGYHLRAGAPHAEIEALRKPGHRARGATLYVTLEPCAHRGRTPPCTRAIIAAGVRRVVIAMRDPDRLVNGRGIAALLRAGIDVEVGDGAAQAAELNRAYIKHRVTGLPYVTLKIAQSLDGFVARARGTRTQISGARAAKFTRELRIANDAVMIGVDTVNVDDPQLTVRPPKKRAVPYTRIVVDSRGRLRPNAQLVRDQRRAKTLVATTKSMPRAIRTALTRAGAQIVICKSDKRGRVDLRDLLAKLGSQGMLSVLCEGGPTLAAAHANMRGIDRIHWIVAPLKLGANSAGAAAVAAPVIARARTDSVSRLGRDVLVTQTPEAKRSLPDSSRIKAS